MDEKRVQRSAYLWNTAAGMLNAFQSVVVLVVISWVCDPIAAGVFTLAYALANQFLNIGKFGMRNYQASDVKPRFCFADYLASRILSTGLMLIVAASYTCISAGLLGYAADKAVAILLVCLLKCLDSIEDVFCGEFQRRGRLDIAGKVMAVRVLATIISLVLAIIILKSLVVALLISLVISIILLLLLLGLAYRTQDLAIGKTAFTVKHLNTLAKDCLPLFLASFLIFFIGSAPKYAIDVYAGDTAQAIYAYIAMPVFIVTLLSSFLYAPIIAPLSKLWQEGNVKLFVSRLFRQFVAVTVITCACVLLAWFFGSPVLNILYNTDVSGYQVELCVLVAGGGFLAFSSLITIAVTILRRQGLLIVSYAITTILALVGSFFAVSNWGISGASWVYLFLMGTLGVLVFFTLLLALRQAKRTL
jgi:O-antigen/teichoic acid export membrane protein